MRVQVLTAGLILGAAFISTVVMTMPAGADSAKVTCPCNCPDDHKAPNHKAQDHKIGARHAGARPIPQRGPRRYSYRDSAPVPWRAWHGRLPVAISEPAGLVIDQSGWTGGVGYGTEGGGGGGYGPLLLANGNSQNGPTYNSFGESFQQNPSMPHPFQNRLMGGLAPTK